MEGDGEKREVSTGGNGREVNSERVVPGSRIIGTTHDLDGWVKEYDHYVGIVSQRYE
jgi:hypothetical protein